LYRFFGYLAIIREYANDDLMLELLNRQLPKDERMEEDDLIKLRTSAGKLLVFDGDRYGLFHDRFRRFLVGERATWERNERVAMAHGKIEDTCPTARFDYEEVRKLHAELADTAKYWEMKTDRKERVSIELRYFAQLHGPHHLIMSGQPEQAAEILTTYAACNERLKHNRSDEWGEDLSTVREILEVSERF
jgi:hypothetical protein